MIDWYPIADADVTKPILLSDGKEVIMAQWGDHRKPGYSKKGEFIGYLNKYVQGWVSMMGPTDYCDGFPIDIIPTHWAPINLPDQKR